MLSLRIDTGSHAWPKSPKAFHSQLFKPHFPTCRFVSSTLFLLSECDPQKEFACSPLLGSSLGQCISLAFVCDGVEQCLNGRDEADCCNNYCDDGVTCIQDDRDGIQSMIPIRIQIS